MLDLQQFLLFALASLMLNITPGNDMVFVATHATSHGIRAGMMAALGIALGCVVHIIAAVLGISAIIAQSAFLFDVIKYLGAAYLIYIGIKSILSTTPTFDWASNKKEVSDKAILKQGIFTNVLNPKVALFFLAFLPQFINTRHESIGVQILLLGLWFNISGTIVNFGVAWAFSKAGNFLKQYPAFTYWQNKITGGVLILLGLKVAFLSKGQ